MEHEKKSIDRILYYLTIIIVIFGIIMVYSASSFSSEVNNNDQFYFAKRQAMWALIGFCSMNITMFFKYHKLKIFAKFILLFSIMLLVIVTIPGIGVVVNGARRWLEIGPFRFQPSEFAKLTMIIFIAYFLEAKGDRIRSFKKGVLPTFIIIGFIFGLILLQRDLGTAAVIMLTGFVLLFLAGVKFLHLLPIGFLGVLLSAYAVLSKDYRYRRFISAFDPWKDPLGSGYQAIQSLYALASGGIFGVGLGNSVQKRLFLPFAHTDFIFSIIAEELGLMGASIIVVAFVVIALRGIKIAKEAPDKFGFFLASGITFGILIQAFINIMVVTATLPVTGMTLPFVSSGGSSLLITMTSVGILLNISRYSTKTLN
ncbi:MAG: putative lipid II flippase FtsW [Clostridia bacterium]